MKYKVKTKRTRANRAYLAEVADGVASLGVPYSHDVEEEGFYIIVERFVVQEELG